MQVLLLCAGQSSRMQPISDKVLLEFCGKTLLERQIENLYSADFAKFVIVGNNENLEAIKNICKKLEEKNTKLSFQFVEQKNLKDGMKGALIAAKPVLNDKVFIVNSNDVVENFILKKVQDLNKDEKFDAVICGKQMENYFPGGYISLNSIGGLQNIVEKPGAGNEPSDLVNIVLHSFKNFHEFFKIVEKQSNSQDDAYEIALEEYAQNHNVHVQKYDGFWQAIKYPWHILDLQNYFLKQQKSFTHQNVQIAESATIKGDNVVIEEGVKIFENAVICGPVYIGKNTVIANNSLIRESCIGENCVIGFQTEVARSFLHKDIWTHSNYIGDSIIDSNVSFGAGTVTGNLRLDEAEIYVDIKDVKTNSERNKLGSIIGSGVRCGIHCSINPGIKIGKNVFLGSAVNLSKNVENNIFICVKQELIERENTRTVSVKNRNV